MKYQIKTKLVLILVIFGSIILSYFLVSAKPESEIKIGQLTVNEPTQPGSFLISANLKENTTISPVLRADFPFNSLYIKWQTSAENQIQPNFDLYVRFLNEDWSDWIKMEIDDDYQGKDNVNSEISSQMIPTKLTDSFQYKLQLNSANQDLTNLQFFYLDTTKGAKSTFHIAMQSNDNDLKIISRAEWGADESLRFDNAGANLWPEEYYSPQKFVIHHTAGEKANLDPKSTIRAIYYWHAREKGWGDIGYNYLIDSSGNIYEGRYGGEAIVAGHAYMRNRNTIGIAILGCYDDAKNEKNQINCNNPDQLTEATQIALNKLIAVKSREFNIDPNGQSEFHGQMLPNVIGHKDVGNTTCPGNLIYGQLPQTRKLAYNFLMDLGGYKKSLPTSAEFVRMSSKDINIEATKTGQVVVEFKNTGQETWRGYEDNYLYITDSEIKKKLVKIDSLSIALSSDKDEAANYQTKNFPIYKLEGGNVYPGQIGKFNLILNAPAAKTETKNFTLAWDKKGYFPDSDFTISVTKIPCTSCTQPTLSNQTSQVYSASLIQSTLPNQIPAETLAPVLVQFQNTGNQTWLKENLKLSIVYEQINISPFRNDSWYSEYALIPPNESSINPGSVANFEFKIKAPYLATNFPHTITLLYNDKEIAKFNHVFEVTSAYAAQITANTLPVAVKTSWRPKVKLTFKNTGTKTWTSPILKSYDIDYTNSWFKDRSWLDNKTIDRSNQKIEPGQEITFEFLITPYWKANTYPHVYKLFDGQTQIDINGKNEFLTYTRVDR